MHRLILAILCVVAGVAQAVEPVMPIARVNGIAIPQARFDAMLQLVKTQGASDSEEVRQQIRSQLIAQELLYQESVKKKLQNDPVVLAAREEAGRRAMIERYVATTVKPNPVSDNEVRASYDRIVQSLGEREFKLSIIGVATEDEARQIIRQLQATPKAFAELARRHSILPNNGNGGSAEWVSFPTPVSEGKTAGLPFAVARVVPSLPSGGVTAEPIGVGKQFWVVRLDEARPTKVPSYGEVQNTLRRTLEAQAIEKASAALMHRLLSAAKVE